MAGRVIATVELIAANQRLAGHRRVNQWAWGAGWPGPMNRREIPHACVRRTPCVPVMANDDQLITMAVGMGTNCLSCRLVVFEPNVANRHAPSTPHRRDLVHPPFVGEIALIRGIWRVPKTDRAALDTSTHA